MEYLIAYLAVGLLFAVITRWANEGPIGIGDFIGYILTGGAQFVLITVIVLIGGLVAVAKKI